MSLEGPRELRPRIDKNLGAGQGPQDFGARTDLDRFACEDVGLDMTAQDDDAAGRDLAADAAGRSEDDDISSSHLAVQGAVNARIPREGELPDERCILAEIR